MDEELEYEMDDEDIEWLSTKLPELKVQLKDDKFEQIIDRLEKESFKQVLLSDFFLFYKAPFIVPYNYIVRFFLRTGNVPEFCIPALPSKF